MSEHTPLASRIESEWASFVALWRKRRWLALIVVAGLICFGVWSMYAAFAQMQRADALAQQVDRLSASLREAERENRGLRETVAPLLARAAREFPGEEINQSLKKLLERLEAARAANQPLATASITVDVVIRSKQQENSHFMDQGGYAALASGRDTLVVAWSTDSYGQTVAADEVRYRSVFQMPADDRMVGRPLSALSAGQYLQIELAAMPENQVILRGKAIVVLNGNLRLEFDVPAQKTKGRQILIPDVQRAVNELLAV